MKITLIKKEDDYDTQSFKALERLVDHLDADQKSKLFSWILGLTLDNTPYPATQVPDEYDKAHRIVFNMINFFKSELSLKLTLTHREKNKLITTIENRTWKSAFTGIKPEYYKKK